MSSYTSLAGGVATLLLGAALLSGGTAVALNWRGCATRYTDFIDDALPTTRRSVTVDRWPRLFWQNRIIFAVLAAFGMALLISGIAGVAG
jgi:hypothetical protein